MINERQSSIKMSYKTVDYRYKPKHVNYLSYKEYRQVLTMLHERMAYHLIVTGDSMILPARMGILQCVKYKNPTKRKVDYHKTRKIYGQWNIDNPDNKKAVYHRNVITEGYAPKVHWAKRATATFKNKNLWSFKFTRPNIRRNSYNKNHPEVSLIDFFKEKGYQIYQHVNHYLFKELITKDAKDVRISTFRSGATKSIRSST